MIRRLIKYAIILVLLAGVASGALYVSSAEFGGEWRKFVVEQLEERGVHLDLRKLTLDPLRGLVARDVRVFNDEERKQLLAEVDRINIDFDFGQLMRSKIVIESLDLAQARVSLPVDPEQPESTVVQLEDLSARIFLTEDRLDIRKAEGTLAGINLNLTGTLVLPKRESGPDNQKKAKENAVKRLEFIRENRQQIQKALNWLARFHFEQKPRIHVEVSGVVDRLQDLTAQLSLSAPGLGYGTYVCEEIEAQAQYSGGIVDLKKLYLKDTLGVLDASGTWRVGGDEVNFRLTSSADIPSLATSFLSSDLLREVVFYESPNLALDGTWYVGGAKAAVSRPLTAIGRLQCGRLATRGEIFDGLSISFGLDPDGFYFRDGLLRHKSGTLSFQALYHTGQGFKYRAVLKMDPHAFIPFVKAENTREVIQRFGFRENSSIFFNVEGEGADPSLKSSISHCRAELREFAYQGVDFDSAESDVVLNGPIQVFSNIMARRREGAAEAQEVYVDNRDRWVRLTGARTDMDLVAIIGCFARPTAQHVARYRFTPGTEARADGVVAWRDASLNDLKVSFESKDGAAHYPLWSKDYQITSPAGKLHLEKSMLNFDVAGGLFGEAMTAKGSVDLGSKKGDYSVVVKAGMFPYEVFGKDIPFADGTAEIAAREGNIHFDIAADTLGGKLTLQGAADSAEDHSPYRGQLRLSGVSFKRFAQTYSPGYDTDGDVTGHFDFVGRMDDWQTLKGSGVMIIVNGNLYAVPVLGPLTPLLGGLLPTPIKGYNVAKEANCTFQVADGFAVTEDFEALTTTFRIVAGGSIDFIRDDIDFNAQARVRGLPGLVLRPVSELLEYKGEGTVGDPKWKPRLFNLGSSGKRDARRAPTKEELEAAANLATQEGAKAASESSNSISAEKPESKGATRQRLSIPVTRKGGR